MAAPSRDDPILQEVTRRLVQACHPDKIYLFGSTARGEAGTDSDYDIMIVVPDGASNDVLSSRQAYDAVRDLHLSADLVVYTRTFFDRRRNLQASLPGTVLREGRLLYRREENSDMPLDPQARLDDTLTWLQKAQKDLLRVDILLSWTPPDVEGAVYHAQQAAEKALKAFLMWHDVPYRKTHQLKELGAQMSPIDPSLATVAAKADALSAYAFKFRYPGIQGGDYEPPLAEGQAALALAREVCNAVLQRLPTDAHP